MDPYMGDTTAASLWRETLTVKLNKLQPVGEVASNPVQSHASYTRVLSLSSRIFYSMVSKALERARKTARECSLRSRARELFSYRSIKANEVE